MRFRIARSKFGYFGVIFYPDRDLAAGVILPQNKTAVLQVIKTTFPKAKEARDGRYELVDRIVQYFEGNTSLIPMTLVDSSICSSFQLKVLEAERSIPVGSVASYSWVARQVGTTSVRAVGSALARNPFPIVVPCHRAVRMTRHIGMYQGGPSMKQQLLEMEGVVFDESGRVSPEHFLK